MLPQNQVKELQKLSDNVQITPMAMDYLSDIIAYTINKKIDAELEYVIGKSPSDRLPFGGGHSSNTFGGGGVPKGKFDIRAISGIFIGNDFSNTFIDARGIAEIRTRGHLHVEIRLHNGTYYWFKIQPSDAENIEMQFKGTVTDISDIKTI